VTKKKVDGRQGKKRGKVVFRGFARSLVEYNEDQFSRTGGLEKRKTVKSRF
jgi:hypothetical protein